MSGWVTTPRPYSTPPAGGVLCAVAYIDSSRRARVRVIGCVGGGGGGGGGEINHQTGYIDPTTGDCWSNVVDDGTTLTRLWYDYYFGIDGLIHFIPKQIQMLFFAVVAFFYGKAVKAYQYLFIFVKFIVQ